MNKKLKWVITLLALMWLPSMAQAKVMVIGDPQLDGLDRNTLKRLYLGKESDFKNIRIQLADLPDGTATRDTFYLRLTNKKPQQVKAYWAKLIFSGRATPPATFSGDDAVVTWVAAGAGRIGYVSQLPEGANVDVLLVIE